MSNAAKKSPPITKNNLGELPSWDLKDLYPSIDAPAIEQDLKKAETLAKKFKQSYEKKVASLTGDQLGQAIGEYEQLSDLLGRLGSYAFLVYAADMSDPKNTSFYQNIQERTNAISTEDIFFTLEINRLEEADLQKKLASPKLAQYKPWIRDIRAFRQHQLSDELETLLHEKVITGAAAWNRLFDETLAGLRFPIGKEKLNISEVFDRFSSPDGKVRKQAAKSVGKVLGNNSKTFALITNVLAKDKEIEDKWRKFPRPISSRNLSNYIEDDVVDALITAVKKHYPELSHRYYKLKAEWFGKKKMDYWDRNAPLPQEEERIIPWQEAVNTVLKAYGDFSPRMAELGKQFFDKNWIDAPVREGKDSGAFAHPTVPSAHPYLLVNYQGKVRDVMTLAHELGHGVHQVLSAKRGLMSDTPLTLAETASVFGEQLTFRAILQQEKDAKRRKRIIAGKVEDMLNTVVRQIAFCEFERLVHDERRKGELSVERIGQLWMQVQKQSLGPAFKFDKEYQYYWSYIPHFIHSPFYVYSYAFGDCLVNSLYGVYQEKPQGFQEKYFTMLEAGGTLWHKELLAPFGLDATRPDFWEKGLAVIAGFIKELE